MKYGAATFVLLALAGGALAGVPAARGMEDLKAKIQSRMAKLRGETEGRPPKTPEGEQQKPDWPFGWIEFLSLLGKCETGRNLIEMLDIEPSEDSVLFYACGHVYEAAAMMENASEEELKGAQGKLRMTFPLMQCVNLQAEREAVSFVLTMSGKDPANDPYLNGAKPLFALCEKVFESVAKEEAELNEDLQEVEENVTERRNLNSVLRELIKIVSRKR